MYSKTAMTCENKKVSIFALCRLYTLLWIRQYKMKMHTISVLFLINPMLGMLPQLLLSCVCDNQHFVGIQYSPSYSLKPLMGLKPDPQIHFIYEMTIFSNLNCHQN